MRDDAELIQLSLSGDADAFADLASRYRRMLYAAAYSVIRSRDEAEDVAQEAVCRIYAGLASFRQGASFGRWAYAIARNAAVARLRSRSREVPLDEAREPSSAGQSGLHEEVRAAVNGLPDRLRTPLLMHYIDGYSGREVAEFLGIPEGTVRSQLTEARRALRKELIPMLKRAFHDLVPEPKVNEFLDRLRAFPKAQPDIRVVEATGALPDPDFAQARWGHLPLRIGAESVHAAYDYPERERTYLYFSRVVGTTTLAGRECFETLGVELPGHETEEYYLSYWSLTETGVLFVGRYSAGDDRTHLYTDPDWRDRRDPYVRYPGRVPLVVRVGEDEFVGPQRCDVAPVGSYEVTVGERAFRCLRAIQPAIGDPAGDASSGGGVLLETYVDEQGRTILWRRYNAAPQWSRERVRGPYQTPGAVERLQDAGNHRIVYNGVEFYHWYDNLTETALGRQC